MRKIIILLLIGVSFSFNTTEKKKSINWMTFDEAIAAQQKNPKKLFVDAYTHWCGWCKKMDNDTFSNPEIIKYMNENFYAVKFNAEGNEEVNLKGKKYTNPDFIPNKSGRNYPHQLAVKFGIRSFPSVLFLDENTKLINIVPGYKGPEDMQKLLESYVSTP